MQKRSFLKILAVGVLFWGSGALEARAGFVPLPTTLDQLTAPGAFTTNTLLSPPFCTFTFDNFLYSTIGGPAANQINVLPYNVDPVNAPNEAGLTFQGPFFAGTGQTNDSGIQYEVHTMAPGGIVDATLSGIPIAFGNGVVQIAETVFDANHVALGSLVIQSGGPLSAVLNFAPQQTIFIQKDIFLYGGNQPNSSASITIFNQGYSCAVPEPASMALLGIGMTGFFALRRFFKRTVVA